MSGISMSVDDNIGRLRQHGIKRLLPLRALPMTEMSPSVSSNAASTPRTMPWSSASSTRIVLRFSFEISLEEGFKARGLPISQRLLSKGE